MFSFREIFKESIGVLLVSSVIGLIGGIFLRSIEERLLVILPLVILLPALNGMIGDFGIIMTSKITTALYERKIKKNGFHSKIVRHLFKEILPISILSAIYISLLAVFIAHAKGFSFNIVTMWKILGITLATTISLVFFIFLVAVIGGIYVYKKKKDPDDILIPITTSVADLGSMAIFSLLVMLLF